MLNKGNTVTLYETLSEGKDAANPRTFKILSNGPIGKGSRCEVYDAFDEKQKLTVRIKQFRVESDSDKAGLLRMIQVQLSMLNSEKTVNTTAPLIGIYYDENGQPWTETCYASGSCYADKTEPSVYAALKNARYLAYAVARYHEAGYLLLDLKPSNIFHYEPFSGNEGVYLFDFDSVVELDPQTGRVKDADAAGFSGTAGYRAPESELPGMLNRVGKSADVFSMGVILFQKIMGRMPIKDQDNRSDAYFPFDDFPLTKPLSPKVRRGIKELFNKTLVNVPENRYQSIDDFIAALNRLLLQTTPRAHELIAQPISLSNQFIGRAAELAVIKKQIREGKNPIILWGFGGIGKSEIAIRFSEENQDRIQSFFVPYQRSLRETVRSMTFSDWNEKALP